MLTVKKLITKLKRFDPDLEVCFIDSQFGATEIDTFDFNDNFQLCFDNQALKDNYTKKTILSEVAILVLFSLSSKGHHHHPYLFEKEWNELLDQDLVYTVDDYDYTSRGYHYKPTKAGYDLIYSLPKCKCCSNPINNNTQFCDIFCAKDYNLSNTED
jgi:hypothetical protein